MRTDTFRLWVVAVAALAASCSVNLIDPPNRKCDAMNPCRTGQACGADGVCADIGAGGGGGSATGGGAALGGGTGTGGGSTNGGGTATGGGAGTDGGGTATGGGTGTGGGSTDGGGTGTGGGSTDGGGTATGGGTGMGGGTGTGGGATGGGSAVDTDAGNPPTYYVDTTGNDSNPGTASLPWATVAKVNATAMPPGSTVLFHGGQSWNESLVPSSSGDAGLPITFGAFGSGKAILDGTSLTLNAVDIRSRAWLSFSQLEVRNAPSAFCVYLQGVDHLAFDSLDVHDCAEGFHASATGVCDDVTVSNSLVHAFTLSPDGGLNNNHAVSLANTCHRWAVTDTELSQCDKACIDDPSATSVFQRLHLHNCGAECINLAGSDSRLESSQCNACTGSAVLVRSSATGVHVIRRNEVWDSDDGFTVQILTSADARFSNNSFIGGRVGGATSNTAYGTASAGMVAFENNLSTGVMTTALSVMGVDAGTLPDGGSAQMPANYVERGNAFDTSTGQNILWDGVALTPAQYLALAGDGGSFFGDPQLTSIAPATPNFTPLTGSPIRDIGVTNPATGLMNAGCDGGVDSYCGAAPEPGAVELP